MLYDVIKWAQEGDKEAMSYLIEKFTPLFMKYTFKLKYEDAYNDIVLYFIETVKGLDLGEIRCKKDGALISYINIVIVNFYNKKIKELMEKKKEVTLAEFSEEQIFYIETKLSKNDETNIFMELGLKDILNENEYQVIFLVYRLNYTTAEIAKVQHKTRQAVNQLKKRALEKIKKNIGEKEGND